MHSNPNTMKELIYELMTGNCDTKRFPFHLSHAIENEFRDGSICSEHSEQIYEAYARLCRRLDVDEDRDVETIISGHHRIAKILALRMFDYGTHAETLFQLYTHPAGEAL